MAQVQKRDVSGLTSLSRARRSSGDQTVFILCEVWHLVCDNGAAPEDGDITEMTPVTFEGEHPFTLPSAQSTLTAVRGDNVEVIFWVLVEGRPTAVHMQMGQRVADIFAKQLIEAAASVRRNRRAG